MREWTVALGFALSLCGIVSGTEASAPSTTCVAPGVAPGADTEIIDQLRRARDRRGELPSLEAEFRQLRSTPLLSRPIESSGTVRHAHGVTLWTTTSPHTAIMRIAPREVSFYYPQERIHELHVLDDRTAALTAVGPELDLDRIADHFAIARESELQGELDPKCWLAIRLTPRGSDEASKGETPSQDADPAGEPRTNRPEAGSGTRAIDLLIDLDRVWITRFVTHDLQGGVATTDFVNIREAPHLTLDDLRLDLPPDVQTQRPP